MDHGHAIPCFALAPAVFLRKQKQEKPINTHRAGPLYRQHHSLAPSQLEEETMAASEASDEIAFFDVETTVPSRRGQGHALLEFGAVLVCPRSLREIGHYSTLIRPADPDAITPASIRCNGITKDQIMSAPGFADVADRVYAILHGRVWAGHNIANFDCPRVREAFAGIGRCAPEPRGIIDSYPLLTERFGRRAGNMKMATLASYFGLGQQKHRSLDDVRMNIEVIKYCATVLFLESVSTQSLPVNVRPSPTAQRTNLGAASQHERSPLQSHVLTSTIGAWVSPSTTSINLGVVSQNEISPHQNHVLTSTIDNEESIVPVGNGFRNDVQDQPGSGTQASHIESLPLDSLIEHMRGASMETDNDAEGFSNTENLGWYSGYLNPDKISNNLIQVTAVSSNPYGSRMAFVYNNEPLQLRCMGLRVHFGLSRKFTDHAGHPKLNIALDAPASLYQLLDFCDSIAQRASANSGSSSEWRLFNKKSGYSSYRTIRLNIPTMSTGTCTICTTEIHQRNASGGNRDSFYNFDSGELDSLFVPGAIVDAYFSVDIYDYNQFAGIRLVAKRLVVNTNVNP